MPGTQAENCCWQNLFKRCGIRFMVLENDAINNSEGWKSKTKVAESVFIIF